MARETYFPHLAILVPYRQSCACLRGQYALRKITRHSNHVPAAEQRPRHRRCPTSRDFVPWRFSDAGRHSSWIASSCRHPKTCTESDIRRFRSTSTLCAAKVADRTKVIAGEKPEHEEINRTFAGSRGGYFGLDCVNHQQ